MFLRRKLGEMVTESFLADEIRAIELYAAFAGIESEGKYQRKGRGALVLTDTELWFRRDSEGMPLRLPLGGIIDVETVRFYLGRKRAAPMIKVTFHAELGRDSAAWKVDRPQQWHHELTRAVMRNFRAQQ